MGEGLGISKTRELKAQIEKLKYARKYKEAAEICSEALKSDPTNSEFFIALGDLYLDWHLDIYEPKQYIDEAITNYQRALEIDLDSPIIHYKIALVLFHKGELDKAINHLGLSIDYNDKIAESHYLMAKCLAKKDRFLEALPHLEKSIQYARLSNARAYFLLHVLVKFRYSQTFKQNIKSLYYLLMTFISLPFDKYAQKAIYGKLMHLKFLPMSLKGLYLEKTQRYYEAIELYSKNIEYAPGFLPLYLSLGDVYRTIGKVSDAINEYRMALWIDPLSVVAYKSLCATYEEMGDYDNAIKLYEQLIEMHPNDAVYYSNLANILYLKGDLKGAVSCYHTAITLNPNKNWTSVIAQTLGFVLQESKENYDAAISAYHSASLLNPNDIDIYINLGSAFYEKGDFANALSAYRAALEIDPNNARVHCNLGYLLWGKGMIEDSIKEYDIAIKLDPTYDIAYNNLGVIYLDDLGRIQKAVEAFENAVRYNPNYALAYYNLGRAAAIKGDNIEAARLFQIALDLNAFTNELDENEIKSRIDNLFR